MVIPVPFVNQNQHIMLFIAIIDSLLLEVAHLLCELLFFVQSGFSVWTKLYMLLTCGC
jgi:hypothetical protein